MSGTTILVIDDDASIHTAVERRLLGVVDEVLKADSPTKGLQFAIQEKPDVILLDVNMPQIDGFKVCRHLQENPTTHDIPILFLTADDNPDNLAKALNAGASDYISKPFNAVELEARVRVALRTKQMIDLLRERARIDALTGLNNRAAMDDATDRRDFRVSPDRATPRALDDRSRSLQDDQRHLRTRCGGRRHPQGGNVDSSRLQALRHRVPIRR